MKIFSFLLIILLPSSFVLEAKPNFILILSDDLGYGDLSCYEISRLAPGCAALTQDLVEADPGCHRDVEAGDVSLHGNFYQLVAGVGSQAT